MAEKIALAIDPFARRADADALLGIAGGPRDGRELSSLAGLAALKGKLVIPQP